MKKSEILAILIPNAFGKLNKNINPELLKWYDEAETTLFSNWNSRAKWLKMDEEEKEFKIAVSEYKEYGDLVGLDKRCIDELADYTLSLSMVYQDFNISADEIKTTTAKGLLSTASEYINLKYGTEEPWTCCVADDLARAIEDKLLELRTCYDIYDHIRNNPTEFISSSLTIHCIERIVRSLISLSDFHDDKNKWNVIKTIRRVRYGFNHAK